MQKSTSMNHTMPYNLNVNIAYLIETLMNYVEIIISHFAKFSVKSFF